MAYINPIPTVDDYKATLEKFKGYYCPVKIKTRRHIKDSCFK